VVVPEWKVLNGGSDRVPTPPNKAGLSQRRPRGHQLATHLPLTIYTRVASRLTHPTGTSSPTCNRADGELIPLYILHIPHCQIIQTYLGQMCPLLPLGLLGRTRQNLGKTRQLPPSAYPRTRRPLFLMQKTNPPLQCSDVRRWRCTSNSRAQINFHDPEIARLLL
jgi:hypothetical protein